MKKIFLAAVCSMLLTACGVGTYSVVSGKDGGALISVSDIESVPVTIVVDGTQYSVNTVKTSRFKKDRKIKETSANTIKITAGQHDVSVLKGGQEVYSKKIFVSDSEHRVIEL